eukprot:CAMPEP_0119468940 /NCGR_PEP_ID=MMETSP1344-20130328/2482_1 /TAXON_ID=236787 /ORGANISM="Florenciella parvula, Strain CCMP2471" /LENGTH=344 /DNA_ID=CAMNT_0007501457 /DNA_START=36 /DNA_END=1070 /DNA_ORIENTATION=-
MSEMRQRKPTGDGSEEADLEAKNAERLALLTGLGEKAPESIRPFALKCAPGAVKIWELVEKLIPLIMLAYAKCLELYEKIKPYHPDDLVPCFVGLAMCFFGGEFPMLIATVVAVKVTGSGKAIKGSVMAIWSEAEKVINEEVKDEKEHAGDEGEKPKPQEVLTRKAMVALKVIDPQMLGNSMTALTTALLAVIASLKLTFARSLSLGSAIGDILSKPALRYGTPIMKTYLDDDYHKWIEPSIAYACRAVAMSVAFWVQQMISAVHSAIQGGQLFTASLCRYLRKYGISTFDPDTSNLDELAGYAVAVLGLGWQLFYSTPTLLGLVLLPLTICEYAIRFTLVWFN